MREGEAFVAGNQGAQPGAPQWQAPTNVNTALQDSTNLRTQLGQEVSSNMRMRIDPDQVDSLAKFFEDEARALRDRMQDLYDLQSVSAPGTDPVSTQAATAYGTVASGGPASYLDNYKKLTQVFHDTATNLRASAQQTRTNDENAASGLHGGNLA